MVKTASPISVLIVMAILLFTASTVTNAQTDFQQELLRMAIPDSEKTVIEKRLAEMSRLLRAEKYDRVYEFLAPGFAESKKQFVASMRANSDRTTRGYNNWYSVVGFAPKGYFVMRDKVFEERVSISGCTQLRTEKGMVAYQGAVTAGRYGTKVWYFETVPLIAQSFARGSPVPC